MILFEAEDFVSILIWSRHPFKCYCLASESALHNSITTTVGARLEVAPLLLSYSDLIGFKNLSGLAVAPPLLQLF